MSTAQLFFPNSTNIYTWVITGIMLLGIFVFGWSTATILFGYFFETMIIGVIHAAKLLATFLYSRKAPTPSGRHTGEDFVFIPFFLVHYFFFIAIQSVFIFLFFSEMIPGVRNSFKIIDNYLAVLNLPGIYVAILSLMYVNVAYAIKNFFIPKKYLDRNVKDMFLQPYLRIFIQQFVTILTGFGFVFFSAPKVAVLLLIFIRLVFDLYLHAAVRSKEFKHTLVARIAGKQSEASLKEAEKKVDMFIDA